MKKTVTLLVLLTALNINAQIVKDTIVDIRDGHVYQTITIGKQTWMAENLAYLPQVNKVNTSDGCFVWGYDGTDTTEAKKSKNYKTYGVLYGFKTAQQVCPTGWHLPSDDEWEVLAQSVSKLKGPFSKEKDGDDWH